MTTKTLTNRQWKVIGVIGNILMFLVTGAAVAAISYIGYLAISSTNGTYEFWHQSTPKELILAAIAIAIVALIFVTCLVLSLRYAKRLLKFTGRSVFKMFERQVQKESDRIQEVLWRKYHRVEINIDRKIAKGQRINQRKAKRGEPVPMRYIWNPEEFLIASSIEAMGNSSFFCKIYENYWH